MTDRSDALLELRRIVERMRGGNLAMLFESHQDVDCNAPLVEPERFSAALERTGTAMAGSAT